MNRTVLDLWVGVFVAAGIVALLFLALKASSFSGIPMENSYRLEARFDNIGGIRIQAPVKSAGVLVGRVTDIRLDDNSHEALVTLRINGRHTFPADTFAAIYTAGLLGDQFISLEPGGSETNLADGGQIAKTQSAIVLEKLISQFMFDKAADMSASQP
jgi:phospholipid/cholesterol/gamma-HCH transport system substrate-binding protein